MTFVGNPRVLPSPRWAKLKIEQGKDKMPPTYSKVVGNPTMEPNNIVIKRPALSKEEFNKEMEDSPGSRGRMKA